jgi:hypothetical protein
MLVEESERLKECSGHRIVPGSKIILPSFLRSEIYFRFPRYRIITLSKMRQDPSTRDPSVY